MQVHLSLKLQRLQFCCCTISKPTIITIVSKRYYFPTENIIPKYNILFTQLPVGNTGLKCLLRCLYILFLNDTSYQGSRLPPTWRRWAHILEAKKLCNAYIPNSPSIGVFSSFWRLLLLLLNTMLSMLGTRVKCVRPKTNNFGAYR